MTRTSNRSFAFVSSTFGATLISIVAAWTVSSVILDPVAPRDPSAIHQSNQPASKHLYRISPIPAGADWTAKPSASATHSPPNSKPASPVGFLFAQSSTVIARLDRAIQ